MHLALGHSLSAVSGVTPNLFYSLYNLYPGVTTLMALSECPRAKCTTRVALFLGALALRMELASGTILGYASPQNGTTYQKVFMLHPD